MTALTISDIGLDRLDEVRDLWMALHRYHAEIGSRPLVADGAVSWQRRRARYQQWLAGGEAFVLLAQRDGRPVGYIVVHLADGSDDTFPLGARHAEIYSLSVAPDSRGQGIGGQLLDAVDARLIALGIRDVAVAAMVENEAALRLYARRGFVAREVVLYRLGSAPEPREDAD